MEDEFQSVQEPVTKKDVEELQKTLTELKTDVKNLQSNVSKDVDGIVNAFGIPVGYLTLASAILNVVLLIVVGVTASKSLSKKDVEEIVKNKLSGLSFQNSGTNTSDRILKADIQKLTDKVDGLGDDLRSSKNELTKLIKSQSFARDDKKKDIEPPEPSIIVAHGFSPRPAQKSITERCKPEYENFMREFDAFQSKFATLSSYDKRREVNMFKETHKIRTFKCENVSARMRVPVPSPIFVDDDSADAIFWAYKLPLGYYAAVPWVKNYADNINGEQAMGDVFKSNFEVGKMYKNVSVITPAIFDIKLNLLAQGELVLSDG